MNSGATFGDVVLVIAMGFVFVFIIFPILCAVWDFALWSMGEVSLWLRRQIFN